MGGLRLEDMNGVPDNWLNVITQSMMGLRNDSGVDFSKPYVRPSVTHVFPVFVFLYALAVVVAAVLNVAVIWNVVKHCLYKDPTYGYIVNLATANIIKCVLVLPVSLTILLVLPVSLTILLVQNWVFGSFLCFFLPMLQVGNRQQHVAFT
jgi:hypothetical protein